MKILYFELRKEFFRKPLFLILLILAICNYLWMEWDYRNSGAFAEEYIKANASDAENTYYEELHGSLDGELTAEKVSYIADEYQRYDALIKGDYSTEYDESMHTGYVFGDYSLLKTNFYNPIKYLVSYKGENDNLVEKAKDNIVFFSEKGNDYEVEKNTYIVNHYQNRNPLVFYETNGWKKLFSCDKSDLFVLVLLMVGIIPSFSRERNSGMEILHTVSVVGRKKYIPVKMVAHMLVAVVLTVFFAFMNFITISCQYGLDGANMMLYSISEYQYTPFHVSVMTFYLLSILFKCTGFAIVAVVMTIIAKVLKNTYVVLLATFGFVGSFLYFSGFVNSVMPFTKALALCSPFSLMKLGEIAVSISGINLGNHFFAFHDCLIGIQLMGIVFLSFLVYVLEKRGKGV